MWYIEYIHVMYKNKKYNSNHNKQSCITQLWSILHQGDGRVRPGNGWMIVTTRGSLVDAVQNLEIGDISQWSEMIGMTSTNQSEYMGFGGRL